MQSRNESRRNLPCERDTRLLSSTQRQSFLANLSFVPRVKQEIKTIHIAALMRGEHLSFYSPQLFFKAILISLQWSTRLSTAMVSHGFTENAPRTHFQSVVIQKRDWLIAVSLLVFLQLMIAYL